MIPLHNASYAVLVKQQSATNAETITSDVYDTLGIDAVTLIVHSTTSNNATNKPSTIKVQEADVDADSNYADVTALVGGGTGGFTIPNMPTATTTAPYAILQVDTRYRKRYLRVKITPITTQTFSVIAVAPAQRREQVAVGTTAQNVAVAASG